MTDQTELTRLKAEMTDYRELEQRLREIPTDINIGWPSDPIDFHASHVHVDLSALCSASADAIKALREENERLRKALALIESQRGAPTFELCNLARAALSPTASKEGGV
jgi:hypothetical protein